MKRSMLFLVAALAFSLLLLCSCSSSGSSSAGSSSQAAKSESISEEQAEDRQCVLYMDDNVYYNGVAVEDRELVSRAEEFCKTVREKYSPVDYDPADVPAGAYIELLVMNSEDIVPNNTDKSKSETDIYIPDYNDDHVVINGEYYHTPDGETTKFASELLKYRDEKQ